MKLSILVLEAKDLPLPNTAPASGLYVKVKVGNSKSRTRLLWNNPNPKWNEQFVFTADDPTTAGCKTRKEMVKAITRRIEKIFVKDVRASEMDESLELSGTPSNNDDSTDCAARQTDLRLHRPQQSSYARQDLLLGFA
ncbi:hypothetical protein MLD38_007030 [Melastoma candidum]|uniref:Uncharacterized protein n=1 Tax=Melastoma candidum TaxID=119954 RepID=A0ACB9RPI3_9MYRT|nr:hypothetical protein MLD38_007030 [Melastoma candidum]